MISLIMSGDLSLFELRGLMNHRLSCCANTVLQTLASTWELRHLLARLREPESRWDSRKVPYQLHRCLEAMSTGTSRSAHLDLLRCLDQNHIQLGVQHDAHEVFLCVLNLLQQQLDDAQLAREIQNLYKTSLETHVKCLQCESVKLRSSFLITLPLDIRRDTSTVNDCLRSFFEHQKLTGPDSCWCDTCEKKTPTDKVVKLLSLPPVLCLHLKRFSNDRGFTRKLFDRVSFEETLDLSVVLGEEFLPTSLQNDCRYSLFAVAVHCGTSFCGHYTAFARHKNQQWFYVDDSHVQKASWTEVQTSYGERGGRTAYMLMYRRCANEEQPECSG